MKRYLTGIQPTGEIHLGNYLGAIKPALDLPGAIIFIADYHALTTLPDPTQLRAEIIKMSAALLALDESVEAHHIYLQSDLPEVQELAWVLSCAAPFGLMLRSHAVKAARDNDQQIGVGLFNYPILMAADILMHQVDGVPVGKDQHQHLQIAQELANKVNQHAGQAILKIPEALISESVGLIPGLDGQKMSKSKNNTIPIFGTYDEVKKIKTDSTPMTDPMDPDQCNVFNLYKYLGTPEEVACMRASYATPTYGYGHAKLDLKKKLEQTFGASRQRYLDYLDHPKMVREVLREGANILRPQVKETVQRVRDAVGFGF